VTTLALIRAYKTALWFVRAMLSNLALGTHAARLARPNRRGFSAAAKGPVGRSEFRLARLTWIVEPATVPRCSRKIAHQIYDWFRSSSFSSKPPSDWV